MTSKFCNVIIINHEVSPLKNKGKEYFREYFNNIEGTDENIIPTFDDLKERIISLRSKGYGVHISLFKNILYSDANEVNIQNTLIYLKQSYERETGKNYKVDFGLDYDSNGKVFVTYTLVPEYLDYKPEKFNEYDEKLLRFKQKNMHKHMLEPYTMIDICAEKFWELHYNKHKKIFDEKYYDAHVDFRSGANSLFPVNLRVYEDINNLGFLGNVDDDTDDEKNPVEKLMDIFKFELNHNDDEFVVRALFKLIRNNIVNDGYLSSEDFNNLSKKYYGIDCQYDEETEREFGDLSYVRCMRNRKK